MTSRTEEDYLRQREFAEPHCELPPFEILDDGYNKYAVFESAYELFEYSLQMPWVFYDCQVVGPEDRVFELSAWGRPQ